MTLLFDSLVERVRLYQSVSKAVVLNRQPPGRSVFWLGRHVYTGTCLHANHKETAWITRCCEHNF